MEDLNSLVNDPDSRRSLITVTNSDIGLVGSVRRVSSAPSLLPSSSCSDNPTFSHAKQGSRLELYVCNRAFSSWANGAMERLPEPWKTITQDMGLCHYMLIVQEVTNRRLHMFDFGPVGGETTLRVEQVYDMHTEEMKAGAAGEIREEIISQLPAGAMYAGCTERWSLDDIRLHNMQQPTTYKLHENDCRHYVNNVVKQLTGLEGASVRLLQHNFARRTRQEKEAWLSSLLGAHEEPCLRHSMNQTTATQTGTTPMDGVRDATFVASGNSSARLTRAAPFLLPLLARLPSWDAPFVLLGQLLSNPLHWQTVQTARQAAAMSFGTAMSLKCLAVSRATSVTPAVAASLVVATSGQLSQAVGAIPQTIRKQHAKTTLQAPHLRHFTAPPPHLAHGLSKAKTAAVAVKHHAMQIAASLVAMSYFRGPWTNNKGKAASSLAHCALGSSLPPLQHGSGLALPAGLVAATLHPIQPWPAHCQHASTSLVTVQPALLPVEALQAAITPEGPVMTAGVPKKRLLPRLTGAVKHYTTSVASASKAHLARLNSTTHKSSSVLRCLAGTPSMMWLSTPPTGPQPAAMAGATDIKPRSLAVAKEWLQEQPGRCLTAVSPKRTTVAVTVTPKVPSVDEIMQPLKLQPIRLDVEPVSPRQSSTFFIPSKPVTQATSTMAVKLMLVLDKGSQLCVGELPSKKSADASESVTQKTVVEVEPRHTYVARQSSRLKEMLSIYSSTPASVLSLVALIMTHTAHTSLTA